MKVLMFMRRFVPAIMGGIKTSTIRTSGRLQVGDVVSMRYWSGLPYRSKTVEFFRARITAKTWVRMDYSTYGLYLMLGNRFFVPWQNEHRVARHEGFRDWFEMTQWFTANHDMPFSGWMLSWEPKLLPDHGECITTEARAQLAKAHGTPSQFFTALNACLDITLAEIWVAYVQYKKEWYEAGSKV